MVSSVGPREVSDAKEEVSLGTRGFVGGEVEGVVGWGERLEAGENDPARVSRGNSVLGAVLMHSCCPCPRAFPWLAAMRLRGIFDGSTDSARSRPSRYTLTGKEEEEAGTPHLQVVTKLLNNAASSAASARTISNGLPVTFDTYASSSPPKPTLSSASTSNGSSVGFQLVSARRLPADARPDGDDDDDDDDDAVGTGKGARTVEEVQNGIKEE